MHRVTRIARATLFSSLALAAAGSLEGAARLIGDASLRDGRIDALQFVYLGIAIYASVGVILGVCSGIILGLLPPARGDWFSRLGRRTGIVLAFVPLAVCAVLGGRLLATEPPPAGSPSVVLITVDTLRADALTSFRNGATLPAGLEQARTPRLDALAADSWRFLDASTLVPKTPQALSTLMTGNDPSRHGVRNLFEVLSSTNVTLAEILREKGWTTRGVVTNGLIDRASGLAQGFDAYRPRDGLRAAVKNYLVLDLSARLSPEAVRFILNRFPSLRTTPQTASAVTDRAVATLKEISGRPYFLWVHYLDPHWPYWPPAARNGQSATEPATPPPVYDEIRDGKVNIGEMIHQNRMAASEVERLVSLYAEEVNFIDAEVGRLIEAIRSYSAGSPTIIIFTSDHGESLGEHRYFFSHGDQVYQPSMRIPLIFHVPAINGRPVQSPVSLADIMPTLLDLLKISTPEEMDGRTLVPRMSHDAVTPERAEDEQDLLFGASDLSYLAENPWIAIPGEAGKVRSVRQGPWKLIRYPHDIAVARRFDPTLGAANKGLKTLLGSIEATIMGVSTGDIIELFDVSSDPTESNDLSKVYPARTAAMTRALDTWLESSLAPSVSERPDEEEMLEHLKSLGYVR